MTQRETESANARGGIAIVTVKGQGAGHVVVTEVATSVDQDLGKNGKDILGFSRR